MDQGNLLATPVLCDFDESGNDGPAGTIQRSSRQVLIPSELVAVRFQAASPVETAIQADLVNISNGGCCLVLPARLDLPIGSSGVLKRSDPADSRAVTFQVRWVQGLGDMMETGLQFAHA
jgi:c-di-GMP-binding flagellar brake protein YcgR